MPNGDACESPLSPVQLVIWSFIRNRIDCNCIYSTFSCFVFSNPNLYYYYEPKIIFLIISKTKSPRAWPTLQILNTPSLSQEHWTDLVFFRLVVFPFTRLTTSHRTLAYDLEIAKWSLGSPKQWKMVFQIIYYFKTM